MSMRCNVGAVRTSRIAGTVVSSLLSVSTLLVACGGSTPAPQPLRGATEEEEEPPHPDPDEACGLLRPDRSNPVLGELPRGVVPLAGPALDGTTVDLGTLYGKVVLVSFQASWDSLTAKEQPTFNALADAVGDRLVILRVASEESIDSARSATPADAHYVTVLDRADPSCPPLGPITRSWGVNAVPESFLIDASGNVRYHFVNKRDWSTPEAIACVRAVVRDGRTPPITSKEVPLPKLACDTPTTNAPAAKLIAGGMMKFGPTAKPGTTVFLLVKRADRSGAPVGSLLAADKLTFTGGDLAFVLDTTHAMVANTEFPEKVVLIARYDQDDDALSKEKGDLTGKAVVTRGARGVVMVVDTLVK